VQATGDSTSLLQSVKLGDPMAVRLRVQAGDRPLATPVGTTLTNGGPQLMLNGAIDITQRRDGFVHPGDPSSTTASRH
jgi:hypothetical protein